MRAETERHMSSFDAQSSNLHVGLQGWRGWDRGVLRTNGSRCVIPTHVHFSLVTSSSLPEARPVLLQSYHEVHIYIPAATVRGAWALGPCQPGPPSCGEEQGLASRTSQSQIFVEISPCRVSVGVWKGAGAGKAPRTWTRSKRSEWGGRRRESPDSEVARGAFSSFLDCRLPCTVKRPPESLWTLENDGAVCKHGGDGRAGGEVHLSLQKAVPGQVWRSAFVGHEELSAEQATMIEGDLHLEKIREVNPHVCLNSDDANNLPHVRYASLL